MAALAAGAAGAGAGDPSDILSPLEQGTKKLSLVKNVPSHFWNQEVSTKTHSGEKAIYLQRMFQIIF